MKATTGADQGDAERCDECSREIDSPWPDHLCGPCYRWALAERAVERGDVLYDMQRDDDLTKGDDE